MSSFKDGTPMSNVSCISSTHPKRLGELEPPDDTEINDKFLLSLRPYRPPDAPSTPTPNSPLSPLSRQTSQEPLDLAKPLSSRGTSPDVTSSPSELSRRIGGSSSNPFARSSSPAPGIQQSSILQPVLVDSEPRPGPEDAEGSTRRWSFRSRKANQLQPYRFDRLQYKRQLRGNPDAVVAALSPHRRRSSPASSIDQDFIADDGENTQETSELSGLTITGEEESQSQPRDSHHLRRSVPSRRASPPAQPPPQWYLDEMKAISDAGSGDDEVVRYLVDHSRKKQEAAEANNNNEVPAVSREWPLGIPEPDPPTRIQTNQMANRGGGGNGVLNPHHGFAISKNRHPDHPTLHRTITTRVARVRKVWKTHLLILGPHPLVPLIRLMAVRDQFTLNSPPTDDQGHLHQLGPQIILRRIRRQVLARSNFEHSVVCCLQE